VIEVTDAKKVAKFYQDVFGLKMLRGGEGAVWCKLGEHQFMAMFEVDQLQPDRTKHFGLMVRDAKQQVGDLSDESLVWLLPYQESAKSRTRVHVTKTNERSRF
jgi:catechol-2,3-dioxygenase